MLRKFAVLLLCFFMFITSVQAGPVPDVPFDGPYLLADIPYGIGIEEYTERFIVAFGVAPDSNVAENSAAARKPERTSVYVFGYPAFIEAGFYNNELRNIYIEFVTAFDAQPAQIQADNYDAVESLFADIVRSIVETYGPIDNSEINITRNNAATGHQFEWPLVAGLPDLAMLRAAHEHEEMVQASLWFGNGVLTIGDRAFIGTNPYAVWISFVSHAEDLPLDYVQRREGVYTPQN